MKEKATLKMTRGGRSYIEIYVIYDLMNCFFAFIAFSAPYIAKTVILECVIDFYFFRGYNEKNYP